VKKSVAGSDADRTAWEVSLKKTEKIPWWTERLRGVGRPGKEQVKGGNSSPGRVKVNLLPFWRNSMEG